MANVFDEVAAEATVDQVGRRNVFDDVAAEDAASKRAMWQQANLQIRESPIVFGPPVPPPEKPFYEAPAPPVPAVDQPIVNVPDWVGQGIVRTGLDLLPPVQAFYGADTQRQVEEFKEKTSKGLGRSLARQVSGMTSPEGLAILGSLMTPARLPVMAGLALYGEYGLTESLDRLSKAKTLEDQSEALGDVLGQMGMVLSPIAAAGRPPPKGPGPTVPRPPEPPPAVPPVEYVPPPEPAALPQVAPISGAGIPLPPAGIPAPRPGAVPFGPFLPELKPPEPTAPLPQGGIPANLPMLDLLPPPVPKGPFGPSTIWSQIVDALGQVQRERLAEMQRRGDFPKALGEKVSQDIAEAEASGKPLTQNQIRIMAQSLADALGGKVAEPRPKPLLPEAVPPEPWPKPDLAAPEKPPSWWESAETWADQTLRDFWEGQGPGGAFGGVPLRPEVLDAFALKGAALIRRGVISAAEWTAEMVKQHGERIRGFLPQIRARSEEIERPSYASQKPEDAAVYGNVRPQPGEGAGQVPAPGSGAGIQPQAGGGLPPEGGAPRPPPGQVLLDAPQAEFNRIVKAHPQGLTGLAWEMGLGVKTVEEANALKALWEAAKEKGESAKKSSDFNAAMDMAMRGQLFREAYEAATGTGSAGAHFRRLNPNWKPPIPQPPEPPAPPIETGATLLGKPASWWTRDTLSQLPREDLHRIARSLGLKPSAKPLPIYIAEILAKAQESLAKKAAAPAAPPGEPVKPLPTFQPPKEPDVEGMSFEDMIKARKAHKAAQKEWEAAIPQNQGFIFDHEGYVTTVTPNIGGGWRKTFWNKESRMPTGHEVFDTRFEAVEDDLNSTRLETFPFEVEPTPPKLGSAEPQPAEAVPSQSKLETAKFPVVRVPASKMGLNPEVMQFKRMDDAATGINKADRLEGTWDELKAGLMLFWEPLDPKIWGLKGGQTVIVANGHHRAEFGLREGVPEFNGQVLREADGYSAQDAARIAAEINIADGKGTIHDQVKLIRNTAAALGKDAALAEARRVGAKGRKAANIAINAADSLHDSFVNERINPDAAEKIALAAPGNDAAQRIGIKAIIEDGATPEQARGQVEAALAMAVEQGKVSQGDFFANTALEEQWRAVGKVVAAERKAISEQILAVQNAARRPELARKLGVDVKDPEGIQKRIAQLKAELDRWDHWADHPDLKARVFGKPAPTAAVEPPPTPLRFKEGDKVWVGQPPMHREGTIVGGGPRGGYFVKTNLGEVFYEAKDIRPFEEPPPGVTVPAPEPPPPPAPPAAAPPPEPPRPAPAAKPQDLDQPKQPLGDAEKKELGRLVMKIRRNRDWKGEDPTQRPPALTAAESARYTELTARAGQQEMFKPGIISGSKAEAWADDTLKKWLSGQGEGQLFAGGPIGPEVLDALVIKGAALLERGIVNAADWSAALLRELGERAAMVRPYLAEIRRRAEEARRATFRQAAPPAAPAPGPAPAPAPAPAPTRLSRLKELEGELDSLPKDVEAPSYWAQRMSDSFDLGQRLAEAGDTLEKGLSGLRTVGVALWDKLAHYEKFTPWLKVLGQNQLARERSSLEAREFAKQVLQDTPALRDPAVRAAISKYIDAGGDPEVLRRGEAEAPAERKQPYRDALNLSPEARAAAAKIDDYFEKRLDDAQRAGILEAGIEDYIHRIYERDTDWKRGVLADLRGGRLNTATPGLAKKRLFQYDFEAEREGYNPVNDFLARVLDYDISLNRALADRTMVRQATQIDMPDGRPMFDTAGKGIPVPAQGETEAVLIKPRAKKFSNDPIDNRGDYILYDHPAFRKWKWVATDEAGVPTILQGDVLVHPNAIKQVKTLLDRSKVRTWEVGGIQAGRALLTGSSVIKQTMLDLSGFHMVQIGVHGLEHRVIPLPEDLVGSRGIPQLDLSDPAQQFLVSHGLTVADVHNYQMFTEGNAGSTLAKLPILGPLLQANHNWLFKEYIPREKMGMALHALERNRRVYRDELASGRMTEDDLGYLTAKQGNAAFGGLNYEMLGRSKTMQDVMRLALLAPDFLEARGRFAGQAFTRYGTEQRVALIFGAAALYTMARILNNAITGDPHWEKENALSLVLNGRSYSLRTVQGDIMHLLTEPSKFAFHRLNPVYGRTVLEFLTHRDEFGRQRNYAQQAKDFATTAVPISLRATGEQHLFESLLNAMGITNRRWDAITQTYKIAEPYRKTAAPGEFIYDPEKDPYRALKMALTYGNIGDAVLEIAKLKEAGHKIAQLNEHFQRYTRSPFSGSFIREREMLKALSPTQRRIYDVALEEKKTIFQRWTQARQAAQSSVTSSGQ